MDARRELGRQKPGRIIMHIRRQPGNAHQMAKELDLDYKTVRHHIDVLTENQMLSARGDGYGRMYFLSPMLETNFQVFEEIWGQIGKTQINRQIRR